jgi:pimeloyl-ACP methyl ester carboxylesterase
MPAQGPSPASSYDVLDDLVDKLSNTAAFPELGRIVLIGHGGGAQMLARYAAVTRLRSSRTVSFIIANSGTYLYLTTTRPLAAAVPCEDVNRWKYGLRDPPRYVGAPDAIVKNFAARDITLLLGGSDVKRSGVLDQSCAAEAQGRNRLERGQYFLEALTLHHCCDMRSCAALGTTKEKCCSRKRRATQSSRLRAERNFVSGRGKV